MVSLQCHCFACLRACSSCALVRCCYDVLCLSVLVIVMVFVVSCSVACVFDFVYVLLIMCVQLCVFASVTMYGCLVV